MSKFGSLLGDVAFAIDAEASALAVTKIPLTRIKPDPKNPRKQFDQTQLEELAESIKERGLLQPITVRAEGSGTSFVIRYGERRWRAAGIAGLTEISAIVTDSTASENDILDQVIENDQRADLSASEMGLAIADALSEGTKASDIAKRLGRPKSVIAEYAALQEMPPFLQELAKTAPIGTVYPLFLAWRTNGEKVETFVGDRAGRPITRAEARALSREVSGKEPPEKKVDDGSEPPLPFAGHAKSSAGGTSSDDPANSDIPPKAPGASATQASTVPVSAPAPAPAPVAAPSPAPARQPSVGDDKTPIPAATVKPAAAKAAPKADIAVVIDGRRARLILPATVEVVFEDDGSTATIASAYLSNPNNDFTKDDEA